MANPTTCEHDDCNRRGMPCFLINDPDDNPSYHFCGIHAPEEGFCGGCGSYIAGSGDTDFERFGLCENCFGDLDEDDWSDDDWDDDPDDFDDL